jgi:hypothetical protein
MAPAIPTLIENRVGIFTTNSQAFSMTGDSDNRSPPKT